MVQKTVSRFLLFIDKFASNLVDGSGLVSVVDPAVGPVAGPVVGPAVFPAAGPAAAAEVLPILHARLDAVDGQLRRPPRPARAAQAHVLLAEVHFGTQHNRSFLSFFLPLDSSLWFLVSSCPYFLLVYLTSCLDW